MYGKFNYSSIKNIISWTSKKFNNKTEADFYRVYVVGYYTPSYANWSYYVAVVMEKEDSYMTEMVFQFGHVIAKGEF